jgi:hypothetical protein
MRSRYWGRILYSLRPLVMALNIEIYRFNGMIPAYFKKALN